MRIVITTTLVIGAILVGILVLRETVAPSWLRPGVATTSGTIAAEPIAPPPALPPALPLVVTPTPATSEPTLSPRVRDAASRDRGRLGAVVLRFCLRQRERATTFAPHGRDAERTRGVRVARRLPVFTGRIEQPHVSEVEARPTRRPGPMRGVACLYDAGGDSTAATGRAAGAVLPRDPPVTMRLILYMRTTVAAMAAQTT